jgi:DNA repair exonuclease SbcCD ATPase subunit
MITFHTIRWKNFLSTGNVLTEIKLDAHQNTLIVGENGSGKSTLLDALCYALFNKPYRNINKPLIVNSINGKECLVEVEFTTGSKRYLVRRGIKPNVFEIWFNGTMLHQDARAKDYQDMLERMILKTNFKSFTQIVLLGTASFTPFMQLKASDRREVIEDLLDIEIFSSMNSVVKDRLGVIKGQMNEYKIRLEAVKEKIELHKRHLEEIKRNSDEMIVAKRSEIANSKHQIIELEAEGRAIQDRVDGLLSQIGDETNTRNKHHKLVTLGTKIETNQSKVKKELDFYKENDKCPTCEQALEPSYKESRIHSCVGKHEELAAGLAKLQEEKDAVLLRLTEIARINGEIQQLGRDIANNSSAVSHTRKYIAVLEQEIGRLTEQRNISGESRDQSAELFEELTDYIEKRKKATEEKQYLDVAAALLKDGGIKTKIIKQYLPIINKLVNKYLAAMDFFVNFTIDEEFKEVIKSRHRDDFSYENFSEGEKQKIDLALLLTWRSIARMKNSVNTNLLILDETFDSSLDTKGTDALLEILHAMPENTNIFVISHKDQLHDKFTQSIRFEKKQNFSRIAA